jgi:hypothetical protein
VFLLKTAGAAAGANSIAKDCYQVNFSRELSGLVRPEWSEASAGD